MSVESEETLWYQTDLDVFLNRWFPNYEAARRSLESEGGYLLPYRRHFYVCEDGAIRALGLEPDDPDWERIGRDCARPADAAAYRPLREKRERAVQEKHG
jgi:hypothetical protein